MIVRSERPEDEAVVSRLVESAFGRPEEADLVAQLRIGGDAVISLVAVADQIIVGLVVFSRMTAPFRALGLAPACVAADQQRNGIGRLLITEGLNQARKQGWEAVFVLGDPACYGRFGFSADLAKGFSSPYSGSHFMALALASKLPALTGRADYAAAFGTLG